jgi:hypothetical protein
MNTITQFSKVNLADLRQDINLSLAEVAKKHGISITAGNARFNDATATFKLEMAVVREGKVVSREMETLKMFLSLIGLTEEHLDKEFRIGNNLFVLAGYNPRKQKNPMVLREVTTDKIYNCSEQAVRLAFGLNPVI